MGGLLWAIIFTLWRSLTVKMLVTVSIHSSTHVQLFHCLMQSMSRSWALGSAVGRRIKRNQNAPNRLKILALLPRVPRKHKGVRDIQNTERSSLVTRLGPAL